MKTVFLRLLPLHLIGAGTANPGKARIDLLDGRILRGVALAAVTDDEVRFLGRDGKVVRARTEDLVSITFAVRERPAPAPGPADVEVLLAGGDVVRGTLVSGKDEEVSLRSPLLGMLVYPVDEVREIRFLEPWLAASEKPAYSEEERKSDVLVYRNLDRLLGTFDRIAPDAVVVDGAIGANYPVSFEKLLAVRIADAPSPPVPKGRRAVLLLTDGSRVTARRFTFDGKTVRALSVRDKELRIAPANLRAVFQQGGRFVYLSDLEPAARKIVPWIGKVYAWDRPRVDRSLVDGPLRAGGDVYQKGLGVISGTSLTWKLDGAYRRFTSRIALDDAGGDEGDVIFEVLVDGETRYRSEVQRRLPPGSVPPRIPWIDLAGAKTLTLRVTWADDFVRDFADWIEPMLVK